MYERALHKYKLMSNFLSNAWLCSDEERKFFNEAEVQALLGVRRRWVPRTRLTVSSRHCVCIGWTTTPLQWSWLRWCARGGGVWDDGVQALEAQPDHTDALLMQAKLYESSKQFAKAIKVTRDGIGSGVVTVDRSWRRRGSGSAWPISMRGWRTNWKG